ncbi:IniB N-terminal domain-containing protein [Microbacterium sp. F51-2R]|uniref:IniB N-terminal domain-containing protein n=1 Tax=Microbacterium sp. F51-2R TaxID=3445777 RepID=UPI003F9FED80
MSTPIATVADALIAFILSLLRDPSAAEEFDAAPKQMMVNKGLGDVCVADVQAVKPVVVDNPSVIVKPVIPPPPPPHDKPDAVIKEIKNIVNQFTTVDARSTIVDQSTNQNIWTNGGDVTQIFDQEAVVASGDGSIAAGDDATTVDSDVDVTVGDVSVGNSTNVDSYNNTGTIPPPEPTSATDDQEAPADVDGVADIAGGAVATAIDTAVDTAVDATDPAVDATDPAVDSAAPAAEEVSAAASDPLADDLTSDAADDGGDAGLVVDDAYFEEPVEEQ